MRWVITIALTIGVGLGLLALAIIGTPYSEPVENVTVENVTEQPQEYDDTGLYRSWQYNGEVMAERQQQCGCPEESVSSGQGQTGTHKTPNLLMDYEYYWYPGNLWNSNMGGGVYAPGSFYGR